MRLVKKKLALSAAATGLALVLMFAVGPIFAASGEASASPVASEGVCWLGVLFGYFLVYSINAGNKAGDALKSLLGVLGLGSGGLLALLPSSSDGVDGATKLTDSATKLATSLQGLAEKAPAVKVPDDFGKQMSELLQKATQTSQPDLLGAKMQMLSAYAEGALIGFVIYVALAVVLAALYSWKFQYQKGQPPTNAALFIETLAKTLLGEDFRPAVSP